MAIELAIRQWARSDRKALVAVGRDDAARVESAGARKRAPFCSTRSYSATG